MLSTQAKLFGKTSIPERSHESVAMLIGHVMLSEKQRTRCCQKGFCLYKKENGHLQEAAASYVHS